MSSPNNPHDALFRRFLSRPDNAAAELRAMLPAALAAQIAWDQLKLIPGSFIDEQLRGRHTDLLYRVPIADQEGFIYVLLEHQSRPDHLMPLRMLRYVVRIWDQLLSERGGQTRLPLIVPLVVYQGLSPWKAPVDLGELIGGDQIIRDAFDQILRFRFILDDLSGVGVHELRRRALSPAAVVTLFLLTTARRGTTALGEHLIEVADELRIVGADRGDLISVLTYIYGVAEPPATGLHRALEQLGPAFEEAYMSIAAALRTEGRTEGRALGRAETLVDLIAIKFGQPTPDQLNRIQQARPADLADWTSRLLTASSITELIGS